MCGSGSVGMGERYWQAYEVVELHPASGFWLFQWIETGILVVMAAALGGVAVRRTRRSRV